MTMTADQPDLLPDLEESIHPHRAGFLGWLERNQITVMERHPMEDCCGLEDGCPYCEEPWVATGRRRAPLANGGATVPMTARGTSDEEACSKLSRWFGIPHWLEGRSL